MCWPSNSWRAKIHGVVKCLCTTVELWMFWTLAHVHRNMLKWPSRATCGATYSRRALLSPRGYLTPSHAHRLVYSRWLAYGSPQMNTHGHEVTATNRQSKWAMVVTQGKMEALKSSKFNTKVSSSIGKHQYTTEITIVEWESKWILACPSRVTKRA